jgi:outer membrane protein assembly factor BamB
MSLKRAPTILNIWSRKSGLVRFSLLSIVVVTAFLALHMVSCSSSPPPSQPSPPTPPPTTTTGTNVTTYHNDNARTGQNLAETILTPSNVNSSGFGKLFVITVDGKVDAQPLYLSQVSIPNQGMHNALYVATEHGSVYGLDADSGKVLWQVSMLAAGETTSDDHGCSQITPEIGVTATPVIDPKAGAHGTIYVVAMSRDGGGNYHQRLHALDVTTGAEEFGGPQNIQASFPGTGDNSSGGKVVFAPGQHAERAGLLLQNGVVYTAWTSHCDIRPYTGWIMGFDQTTLALVSVLNLTPNGNEGSVWMSGAGLAADTSGNIFLLDANGTFDTTLDANGFPGQGDYGNAFLKISTANRQLAVADYFEMSNQGAENGSDEDLGSGGALVLPDLQDSSNQTRHLAVGAGKDANIYIVDRDAMGKFNPNANNIYQEIPGALSGSVFSMPAYFNNTVYYGAVGDNLKAFVIISAKLASTATSQTANAFGYPGATPSISANGTSNAILWAAENGGNAVLHAYDATNLAHELYNSNQAPSGRDQFGAGNKFITPMITNGKVYVGTTNGVGVFGLLQ